MDNEKIKKGWHANGSGECPFKNRSCKVEPLREIKHVKAIKKLLVNCPRDFALFVLSINTGLRANDVLSLKWVDVLDENEIKAKLKIQEAKTGIIKEIVLCSNSQEALQSLLDSVGKPKMDSYIFGSRKGKGKMTLQCLNQLINKWTKAAAIKGNFGSQSLRKTFAHFALRKGLDIHKLMKTLKHLTPSITLRFAGVEKEDWNKTLLRLNL